MRSLKTWFSGLSTSAKVVVLSVAALLAFGAIGSAAQPSNTPSTPDAVVTSPAPSPKIEYKTETKTESIPFKTATTTDASLPSGTTQIRTAGINGTLTHTYKVTYTDGVETARSEPSSSVTTQPIDEVKVIGTYVTPTLDCPNRTYVNSAGKTVCSPYSSSSAPSGASAQCADGTYSFSQSRRGTCSHHGGVSKWL